MMVLHKHTQQVFRFFALLFITSLLFAPASVVLAADDATVNTVYLPFAASGGAVEMTEQSIQAAAVAPSNNKLQMLIPLYIFPLTAPNTLAPAWQKVIDAGNTHPNVPITVIVNPNSGPVKRTHRDFDHYLFAMKELKKASRPVRVLGYVPTKTRNGNNLSVMDVHNLIARWHNIYRDDNGQPLIDGMFLDQAPTGAYSIYEWDYYYNYAGHVQALSPTYEAVLNPGAPPMSITLATH